jgi:hypothetical protein
MLEGISIKFDKNSETIIIETFIIATRSLKWEEKDAVV